MSQEENTAPLVSAPNQSAAMVENIAEGFANYLYQRDMKQIEEQSLIQKRMAERHREDIVNVVKLLFNNQPNAETATAAILNGTSTTLPRTFTAGQAELGAAPETLPVSQSIIDLNAFSSNPEVPFQSTRSSGGAMEILNYSCTEDKCTWRGPKDQFADHLRRQHQLKPHRCLQKLCEKSYYSQENLQRHTAVRHKGQVQCFQCGRNIKTYVRLVNHYKLNHEKGLYQCSVQGCKAVFETKQQTYNHRYNKCPLRFAANATATSKNIATRSQATT